MSFCLKSLNHRYSVPLCILHSNLLFVEILNGLKILLNYDFRGNYIYSQENVRFMASKYLVFQSETKNGMYIYVNKIHSAIK